MQVQEIMTKDVKFCHADASAAAAAEMMWAGNCGAIPVIGEGGRVVGIFTDRDAFIALGTRNKRAGELPVSEIMNTNLVTCSPADDIRVALKNMAQARVMRLPVVDKTGCLLGMVSMDEVASRPESDILAADLIRSLRAISIRCEPPKHGPQASSQVKQAVA
jgi:CBS domain-containing protein